MANTGPITFKISARTRFACVVLHALTPAVVLGLVAPDRAVAFAMSFVRVDLRPEGWGGD
jgi:hypothetical protein